MRRLPALVTVARLCACAGRPAGGEQVLAFYDTSMTRVVEPGTFTVYAGTDAEHTQAAHFTFATSTGRAVRVPARCEASAGATTRPTG